MVQAEFIGRAAVDFGGREGERERGHRFEIDDLMVLKFSLPRPNIQGTPADSDMHGAALGALLKGYDLAEGA